jgi:hypothetical protein
MEGLHDEKLWPKNLSPIETEERRKLVCILSSYGYDFIMKTLHAGESVVHAGELLHILNLAVLNAGDCKRRKLVCILSSYGYDFH